MTVLWITINLPDLQFPLVIHLVGVKLDLENNMQSTFAYRTIIMNPVIIAKFFHIIYNVVFMSLLAASQLKGGLPGLISNYFAIIETNGHSIL